MIRTPSFPAASREDSDTARTAYLLAVYTTATGEVLRSDTKLMLMTVPRLR
jgi:hypothetical protein